MLPSFILNFIPNILTLSFDRSFTCILFPGSSIICISFSVVFYLKILNQNRGGHKALENFRSKKSSDLFFNKHQLIAWDEIFILLAGEKLNLGCMKKFWRWIVRKVLTRCVFNALWKNSRHVEWGKAQYGAGMWQNEQISQIFTSP